MEGNGAQAFNGSGAGGLIGFLQKPP